MCGIAGIISQDKKRFSEEDFHAALSCLQHRGPQGKGYWKNEDSQVIFGHRRLAIIDLSDAAAQPMHFSGRYTIVHNGEIYNYIELRKELEQKGYQFHSSSDTEIILAAYDAWKKDCVKYFDGMFAFAIWDEKEKTFFAARDRMGEKPFYFYYDGNSFCFASEMKFFWRLGIPKEVNRSMLFNFLTIGYTANPGDPQESFYTGIHQLPAASFVHFNFHDKEPVIEKYWQPEINVNQAITAEEAIEQFRKLFSESIRKRMRSDVAIGTSLSGGIDSSSIVALCDHMAADHYSHECFTAVFKGFEKDEAAYASMVASKFGLRHHLVEINDNEVATLMQKVMNAQEMPFSSASVLAQYKVYEAAKKNGVIVLLDGQGADELLGGYSKYYQWYWSELYRQKKLGASGEQKSALINGIKQKFSLPRKIAALFPEFAGSLLQSKKSRQAFKDPLLNRDFAFTHKRSLYYSLPTQHDLNGILYFDSFVNGLDELLRLADRNSMAHSTEVRLPFLSHELIEFLFTLPPQFKIHQGWSKWLLRKALSEDLPAEITWRKDKVGFEPPQMKWMQNKDVEESIMEGKKKLVDQKILDSAVLKKNQPHSSYAAGGKDWKYWSASFLFN